MKGTFLTAVAALLGTTIANNHVKQRHHGHDAFHVHRALEAATPSPTSCGCYTTVVTYWGSPTLLPATSPTPSTSSTTTITSTTYYTVTVQAAPPTSQLPGSGSAPPPASSGPSVPYAPPPASSSPPPSSAGPYAPPPASSSSVPYAPPPASSSIPSVPYVPPPASSSTISSVQAPPPATSTATSSVPSAAAPVPGSSTSNTPQPSSYPNSKVGNGARYGMTYSPYTSQGGCQNQGTIESDIADIATKGFKAVRIYSTDCNGLEYVGTACRAHGLHMIIGVYISSSGTSGAQNQVQQIVKWAQWDLVDLIVVGNEAILDGHCSAGQLAGFISTSASAFKTAGYSGDITTTEPLDNWQTYGSTLCSVVDKVGANLHPFFDAQTTAADAGTFVKSELAILRTVCPGKTDIINLETGWPTQGSPDGVAVPGSQEQITALTAIVEEAGDDCVFFSYANDSWKPPGEFGVEPYWGCGSAF